MQNHKNLSLEEAMEFIITSKERIANILNTRVKDITKEDYKFLEDLKDFTKPCVEIPKDDKLALEEFNKACSGLTNDIERFFRSNDIKSAVKFAVESLLTNVSGPYRYMVNWTTMLLPSKSKANFRRSKDNYMRVNPRRTNLEQIANIITNHLCNPVIGTEDMSKLCGSLEDLLMSHYIKRIDKEKQKRPIYESMDEMELRYKLNAIKSFVDDEFVGLFKQVPGNQTIHFKSPYAEEARRLYFTLLRMQYNGSSVVNYKECVSGKYMYTRYVPKEVQSEEDGESRWGFKLTSRGINYNSPGAKELVDRLTMFFADTYTQYLEFRDFNATVASSSGRYSGSKTNTVKEAAPMYSKFNHLFFKTGSTYSVFGVVSDDIVNPFIIFDNFVSQEILLRNNVFNWDVRIHSNSEYNIRIDDSGDSIKFYGTISDLHKELFNISDMGFEKWKCNDLGVREVYPTGEGMFVMQSKKLCGILGIHYQRTPAKFFSQILRRALPYSTKINSFVYIPEPDSDSVIDLYNEALAQEASYSVEDDLALYYHYNSEKDLDDALYAFFEFMEEDEDNRQEQIDNLKSWFAPQSVGKGMAVRVNRKGCLVGVSFADYSDRIDYVADSLINSYIGPSINE